MSGAPVCREGRVRAAGCAVLGGVFLTVELELSGCSAWSSADCTGGETSRKVFLPLHLSAAGSLARYFPHCDDFTHRNLGGNEGSSSRGLPGDCAVAAVYSGLNSAERMMQI